MYSYALTKINVCIILYNYNSVDLGRFRRSQYHAHFGKQTESYTKLGSHYDLLKLQLVYN